MSSDRHGSNPESDYLLDAAYLGSTALRHEVSMVLAAHGAVLGWDEHLAPLTARLEERWSDGDLDGGRVHRLHGEVAAELRRWTSRRTNDTNEGAPVAIIGVDVDEHGLPLAAVHAALGEHGFDAWVVGTRVSDSAITHTLQRRHPTAVVLWADHTVRDQVTTGALDNLVADPATVLAGPGWSSRDDHVTTMTELIDVLRSRADADR